MLFKTSMNFFLHKNIKEDILWTSMDKSLVWKKTLKKNILRHLHFLYKFIHHLLCSRKQIRFGSQTKQTCIMFSKNKSMFSLRSSLVFFFFLIMSILPVWGNPLEADSSSESNADVFRGSYATFHSFSSVNSRCTEMSLRPYHMLSSRMN